MKFLQPPKVLLALLAGFCLSITCAAARSQPVNIALGKTVTFSDAPQGTEIDIVISYHAPLGMIGEKTGRLLNPIFERIVREDIRNFKEYIETGMVSGPRAAVES